MIDFFLILAKNLPKNENETAGAAAASGGGRRLLEGAENTKTAGNCCK